MPGPISCAAPARLGIEPDITEHDGPATFDEFSDLIEEVRFARDSPLEGGGFEPSVPRQKMYANTEIAALRAAVARIGGKMAKMPICTVA
jgi:hypothetical protein